MARYLVTGATGFVGNRLVALLGERGHQVRVYHRASSRLDMLAGATFETAVGELDDVATLARALDGCDGAFHVAGVISYAEGDLGVLRRTNVDAVKAVVDAARRARTPRLVHTSSVATIGWSPDGAVGDEDTTYNWPPGYGYMETKRDGEGIALGAASAELAVIAVNPSVVMGPGDPRGAFRTVAAPLSKGLLPFHPPGAVNVVDVDDVVSGHLLAMDKGRSAQRYILGGENVTNQQLLDAMSSELGVRAPRFSLPAAAIRAAATALALAEHAGLRMRPAGSQLLRASLRCTWVSSAKAERELGYRSRPLADSVRRMLDYYRERGWV